jgi:DNA polymerase III subunit gamma/tau
VEPQLKRHEPLYLKHRPQALDQLVGQESVRRTLTNAINFDRISHAYLFTGPRGTGKTSSARILAKSLNCKAGDKATATPCQECISCMEIKTGNSTAVFEIDAASNNSVEDARVLIERAPLVAPGGRYKIYIIDECHMLSKEAFNALLKTIEDPPPNVVFILATTEEHKVIPTIVSRCQRLMFRLVQHEDLLMHLRKVADQEGIEITDRAIDFVARRSGGGLRDALGLLDQASLLSAPGKPADVNDLLTLLGALNEDVLLDMSACVLERRGQDLLAAANKLLHQGREPAIVVQELARHFLSLTKASYLADTADRDNVAAKLIVGSPEYVTALYEQAPKFERSELSQLVEVLDRLEQTCRRTTQPGMHLEVGLLGLCHRQDMLLVRELAGRVARLEQALAGGASIPASGQTARASSGQPASSSYGQAQASHAQQPQPSQTHSASQSPSYNQSRSTNGQQSASSNGGSRPESSGYEPKGAMPTSSAGSRSYQDEPDIDVLPNANGSGAGSGSTAASSNSANGEAGSSSANSNSFSTGSGSTSASSNNFSTGSGSTSASSNNSSAGAGYTSANSYDPGASGSTSASSNGSTAGNAAANAPSAGADRAATTSSGSSSSYNSSPTSSSSSSSKPTAQSSSKTNAGGDDDEDQGDSLPPEEVDRIWGDLLAEIQRTHIPSYGVLVSAQAFPVRISDTELVIGIIGEPFQKTVESRTDHIKRACNALLGKPMHVKVRAVNRGPAPAARPAAAPRERAMAPAPVSAGAPGPDGDEDYDRARQNYGHRASTSEPPIHATDLPPGTPRFADQTGSGLEQSPQLSANFTSRESATASSEGNRAPAATAVAAPPVPFENVPICAADLAAQTQNANTTIIKEAYKLFEGPGSRLLGGGGNKA